MAKLRPRRKYIWVAGGVTMVLCGVLLYRYLTSGPQVDERTVVVTRGTFRQTIRRLGTLKAVKEEHVVPKLSGLLLDIKPDGTEVAKGDMMMRLDPTAHEDSKVAQESAMRSSAATFKQGQEQFSKDLNQAKEDVTSWQLRVELESARLEDVKRGADPGDLIKAETNLKSAKIILDADRKNLESIEALAKMGYVSKDELRQNQLLVTQQEITVTDADIALRKLKMPDEAAIATQFLAVQNAQLNLEEAASRVTVIEKNIARDVERQKLRDARDVVRLQKLIDNISKTFYPAPTPGVVLLKAQRWFYPAPGRNVWDGREVLSLPDLRHMMVALTVDEAHVAEVHPGQEAEVRPAGWTGKPFRGKVTRVAAKGHDEFEQYLVETVAIVGTANRQVFDVDVEIEGESTALHPGLRASVEIVVAELSDVLIVPRTALSQYEEGNELRVAKFTPKGKVQQPVQVLAKNDYLAAVNGLEDGDRVWLLDDGGN